MHDGHSARQMPLLLAQPRLLERHPENALRSLARNHALADRRVAVILTALATRIQVLGIFAHDQQVDVLPREGARERLRRPQVGVQVEALAQQLYGAAVAFDFGRGRAGRAEQGRVRLRDTLERLLGQGCADALEAFEAGVGVAIFEIRSQRFQDFGRGRDHLVPHAVAGDQTNGCHSPPFNSGMGRCSTPKRLRSIGISPPASRMA